MIKKENLINLKIAVILPAYNEEITIGKTIESYVNFLPNALFVIVDNNSTDDTRKIALEKITELGCKGKILREYRQGKGAALRKAFSEINADYYIMTDADDTYPAKDAYTLLEPVISDKADIVIGDRHSSGDYKKENKRKFHNLGNMLVTRLINFLFKKNLKDIMSGYRAMNKKFVKNFPILSSGFEVETEMTLHTLDKKFRIKEVPIHYKDRPRGSLSKLNTFSDGIRILKTIIWVFKDFSPLLFFGFFSLLFFIIGLLMGIPVVIEFIKTRFISHVPLAILATGLMIFSLLFFSIGFILDTIAKFQRFNFELQLIKQQQDTLSTADGRD